MARMQRSPTVLLCASFFVVLLLVSPGTTARALRPDGEVRRLSEQDVKASDDAVPTSAKVEYEKKYAESTRFLKEVAVDDYEPAANPSIPCC